MTHEGRKIKIGKNLLPTPEFSHNYDLYLKFGEGERIKKKTKGGKKKENGEAYNNPYRFFALPKNGSS